jgi:3-phosphoinositide dependent protein kinase-1
MFEEDKKNLVRNDKRGLPQIRNYQLIKKIGQGTYGKIYLAEDTKNLNLVALKIIDKTFLEILGKSEEAFIEQYMLIHLKHNNIMNLKSCFQTKQKLIFVLQYLKNGNFEDYLQQIQSKNGILSYETSKFYLAEILNILLYFQEKKLAHLDLKPGNIIMDERLHLKLIDFATAKIIGKEFDIISKKFITSNSLNNQKNLNKLNIIGTLEYTSPEMLNENIINYKSCDIWSFGIIMYELFHGYTPFKGQSDFETIENIKNYKLKINEKLPNDVKDLIKKLLTFEESKRIGFNDIKEIMNHKFFQGINFNNLYNEKVPENFKKSISDSQFLERKISFQEELYSTDESTENEIENIIDNLPLKNSKNIINFSFGNDYCVVKYENNLFFHDDYFL